MDGKPVPRHLLDKHKQYKIDHFENVLELCNQYEKTEKRKEKIKIFHEIDQQFNEL